MKATLSFPSHPIPSPPCEKIIHGRGKKGEVEGGVPQKAITHKKYVYFFLLEEDEGKKKEPGISFGTHTVLSGAICGLWKKPLFFCVKTRIKEVNDNPSQPLPAARQGCSQASLEQLCCEHQWHFSFSASNVCNRGQQIFQQTLIYLAPYWQNCRCLSKEKQMPLSQQLCFAVVSIHFALALCEEPQWHCSCFTSLHQNHSLPDPLINHISKGIVDGATPLSMRGQASTPTFLTASRRLQWCAGRNQRDENWVVYHLYIH